MKIYYYIWKDSTVSFVVASCKEEAQDILDEIGEAGIEDIKEYRGRFMTTFHCWKEHLKEMLDDENDDGMRYESYAEESEDLSSFILDLGNKIIEEAET